MEADKAETGVEMGARARYRGFDGSLCDLVGPGFGLSFNFLT